MTIERFYAQRLGNNLRGKYEELASAIAGAQRMLDTYIAHPSKQDALFDTLATSIESVHYAHEQLTTALREHTHAYY